MSDALWAARLGDDLMHSSMMADILGGVLEVAAYVAITAVASAAIVAATGLTILTGGLGGCVLALVVGVAVGVGMNKTGLDKGLTTVCESLSNGLFPPSVQAKITSGATKTFTNGIPSARAAGKLGNAAAAAGSPDLLSKPLDEEDQEEPSFLDMAKSFFSEIWRPTVAVPAPGVIPCPLDTIACTKHPPMPLQLLAEGSVKVSIEGQPAVRSGDRATCDATVVDSGNISSNVRIGGDAVVVQPIRSGKTPGVGLALSVLMALRGRPGKLMSNLPCMAMGIVNGFVVSQVAGALTRAISGSPNPVHAATGAKILSDEEDRDFVLPGLLPIEWQRFYSSRDERRHGLFGAGWGVPYEVSVHIEFLPEGGDTLIYTDEQGRRIDLGWLAPGDAVYGSAEGLAVRRDAHTGALLIESVEGIYRLFETDPADSRRLRLTKLGDRNDNRLLLDYDEQGRLIRLGDRADQVRLELVYDVAHPQRVARAERLYPDTHREVLARYGYDAAGDLAEVRDGEEQVLRRFVYDSGRRMVEHQRTAGQRCFYEWTDLSGPEGPEWRVARHWTDAGDEYRFAYDLQAGLTRVSDGLGRVSERQWNAQYQITRYSDALGQTWSFDWNDERQLLAAIAPDGARWTFAYDDSGNLCKTLDPLGRHDLIQWLEHWSLPLAEIDPAGHGWRYRYDKRGNCTHEIDPLGQVTRYHYDERGLPVKILDALGNPTRLRWNALGQLLERLDCSGYTTRFAYDERGHLRTITDALGEHTWYQHDAKGNLLQKQLPDGRREQLQRAANGQLLKHIDPAGKATGYLYNRRGQVLSRTDPLGRRVAFEYDAYGRLQALTNENGESYRFAWDAADRLTVQQDLDGSARHYRYDARDEIVAVAYAPAPHGTGLANVPQTPIAPIVHHLERDAAGRLVGKVTDDGRTEYTYDPLDQLTAVTFTGPDGDTQTLGFAYDALGRLLEEQGANGSLQHAYDELGNLLETQVPDGRSVRRLYYGSGHLQIISLDEQIISRFERDRLHREVLRSQGQLVTHSQYDRSGRVTARLRRRADQPVQLPALAERRYDYDPSDNLIGRLDRDPQASREQRQHLHYDASGRILASQDGTQGRLETYAYDAAANLLDGPAPNAGWVVHNKLVTYQDKRYRYDAFGRLVEKRSGNRRVQRLRYDAEHRLIEVTNHDGMKETRVVMRYDPLGRRIEKRELDSSGRTLGKTDFTWDGMRLLAEEKNGRHSLYLYDEDSYEPLARVDGQGPAARVRYYHNDPNGLPQQLTETDGHCLWQATYQVWGNTVAEQYEPYFVEEQNLRFQGQYLDRETGLHYNTFRFYDPDIGRFISPDPIGLAGGNNLFEYAPNPAAWIDPWGLLKEGETAGYGAAAHKNDGLEAHEVLRNKFLEDKGIATGRRVKGNPSIALSPRSHDAVHLEENRLRKGMGLSANQMLKRGKLEIRLMSQAIYNSLVTNGKITQTQLRIARRYATSFAKNRGCY